MWHWRHLLTRGNDVVWVQYPRLAGLWLGGCLLLAGLAWQPQRRTT
ncbi:MAG TPA: hypothetical protein PKM88_11560 [bacterium]|nr:hypothetical protein [bacterium]